MKKTATISAEGAAMTAIAVTPEERVGQLIRSNHRWAFRSGQWGTIIGLSKIKGAPLCFDIRWNEGHFSDEVPTSDRWMVDDPPAEYEFAQVIS